MNNAHIKNKELNRKIVTWAFIKWLFFYGVLSCIVIFFVGFHNLDLGQNLRYLEAEYHLKLSDMSIDGHTLYTSTEMYLMGAKQMIYSFLFGLFSVFGFMVSTNNLRGLLKSY